MAKHTNSSLIPQLGLRPFVVDAGTRCPYYDKYKELGLEEFGVGFSCCRDKPFARGFNPKLRLERTKTIMEGSEYCAFRYYLNDK